MPRPTLSRNNESSAEVLMRPRLNPLSLVADSNNTSSSSLPSAGLRAHIQQLFTHHAYYHACIQIHDISNIPLVTGEFAVKWHFKNATKASRIPSKTNVSQLRKKEENEGGSNSILEIPSVVISGSRASSISTSSSPSRTLSINPLASTSSFSIPLTLDSPTSPSSVYPCQHPHDQDPTASRGITPYLPLQEHSVDWSKVLHMTLKIPISRPDNILEACPFKLVILQKVVHGAPRNPRLGVVYLDLSQYASVEGVTSRSYLLRESKTNATLKLTVSMTYVGGGDRSNFTAPPLPNSEILKGISDLLDDDVYRTVSGPRALDLVNSYHTFDPRLGPNATLANVDGSSDGEYDSADDDSSFAQAAPTATPKVPFDVRQLPFAYGTKTTEALIEALFNPVVLPSSTAEASPNPFVTYDVSDESDALPAPVKVRAVSSSESELRERKKRNSPGSELYRDEVESVVGIVH